MKPHSLTNIGSRNKGGMWEYITATAYKDLSVPGSKYRLTELLAYGENESNQHCLAIDELASGRDLMIKEFEAGAYTPKFFHELENYYNQPLSDFKKFASKKLPQDFSDKELIQAFDLFSNAVARTYPPMLIAFFAAYLDDYFTQKLKKVVSLDDAEFITLKTTLLTMPRASISEREEEAIMSLVRLGKVTEADSQKLADNFGWFHMEYAGDPHTKDHYKEILKNRLTLKMPAGNISEAKKEVLKQQEEFFAKYKNNDLEKLTRVMQDFAFILDDSKRATVENHYIMYPLLEEIARRVFVPFKDIYFLAGPEIREIFEKPVDRNVISERKKYRAVFLHDGVIEVLTGEKAKEAADKYIEIQEVRSDQDIKGIVAYPGFYRGKVSLILNPNNHGKFKDGDVLVTRDGSVEFTYFLQHAGAIVADQGGIISHAAIVARESKVPAILSTKVGTKILKDGDIVEVDAKKGIVKIIERAKK